MVGSWGLLMAVLFSAAAAYLGLKVGQVFEAAIPIAIIAVGLSSGFHRKNALGENVIIQSIGANSGVIVVVQFSLCQRFIFFKPNIRKSVSISSRCLSAHFWAVSSVFFCWFLSVNISFTTCMGNILSGSNRNSTSACFRWKRWQSGRFLFVGPIGGIYDFIIATFGWWSEPLERVWSASAKCDSWEN